MIYTCYNVLSTKGIKHVVKELTINGLTINTLKLFTSNSVEQTGATLSRVNNKEYSMIILGTLADTVT